MSELSEALKLSAALPSIYQQERERLNKALDNLHIVSNITMLADAIEKFVPNQLHGWEGLLSALGVEVRCAIEHFPNNRLEHKHFVIGNSRKASKDIGNGEILTAWIVRK